MIRKRYVAPTEAEAAADLLKALRKDVRTYTKARADWIERMTASGRVSLEQAEASSGPVAECDRLIAQARAEITRLTKG